MNYLTQKINFGKKYFKNTILSGLTGLSGLTQNPDKMNKGGFIPPPPPEVSLIPVYL